MIDVLHDIRQGITSFGPSFFTPNLWNMGISPCPLRSYSPLPIILPTILLMVEDGPFFTSVKLS